MGIVPPVIVPFSFGDEAVDAGASVQASCMVSFGDVPVSIKWSFHGTDSLTSSQKGVSTMKFGARSSVLMIENVNFEHSGLYICKATNAAGSAEYTAKLVVNGKKILINFFLEHCCVKQ